MKALALTILAIMTLSYPFIIFFGISHFSPAIFGAGLILFTLFKLVLTKSKPDIRQLLVVIVLVFYSLFVAVSNSQWALRLYPVVINVCVAAVFLLSLFEDQSMIERFARAAGKKITPNAKEYTKKLTLFWVIVLLVNAMSAVYFAFFATLKMWALYNGLIAYVIFASIFALELLYRQHYIKKYGK